jgi:hypothetical protein
VRGLQAYGLEWLKSVRNAPNGFGCRPAKDAMGPAARVFPDSSQGRLQIAVKILSDYQQFWPDVVCRTWYHRLENSEELFQQNRCEMHKLAAVLIAATVGVWDLAGAEPNSCSGMYARCVAFCKNTPYREDKCMPFCSSELESCKKTGNWYGWRQQRTGLQRN